MTRHSRIATFNEIYINQLETEIMALSKTIDDLVAENYALKQELEELKKPKNITIPDLDYPDKYYWEGRN
jgi:regulator of replication initiation timing